MQSANTPVFRSVDLPPQSWSLSRIVLNAVNRAVAWEAMARSRKSLSQLDAHLLRDIGLDATTAQEQATRPFWYR